jgi:V/A-type H+-transporting ATPase subunit F
VKFYCIADEDTVRGFRLAGVAGVAVNNAEEAAAAVERAVAEPDHGIIVLTQQVAAGVRAQLEQIRLERPRPLIVEIPGAEGPAPGRLGLRQIVQQAVGIQVSP